MQTDELSAGWDQEATARFLASCGAPAGVDAYGPAALFPALGADDGIVAPLPEFGLIAASGADATSFLHAQLTNDLEHLPAEQARWYGYCTPKGRLLATVLGWRSAEEILLWVPRPLAAGLCQRLARYVMRAKVKLEDRSNDTALFGLAGTRAAALLAGLGVQAPEPLAVAVAGDLTIVGLPPALPAPGTPRWLLVAPAVRTEELWSELGGNLTPASSTRWRWLELRSGMARVVPVTSGRHVPQTLNLDLLGGVNFQKGCYPGQEVVARTHYRGTAKRRMFLGKLDGNEPLPGEDILADGAAEAIGSVIIAAANPAGGAELLFEAHSSVVLASIEQGTPVLRVGSRALVLAAPPFVEPG